MKSSKGGARRYKVEECCTEHLYDTLQKWYQANNSFDFGEYNHLSKTQGSSISDLVRLEPLIVSLMDVSPGLNFLYKSLKEVFQRLLTKFPDLKKGVALAKLSNQAGDLANNVTTLCTHVRRLRKDVYLEQSLRKCTAWQGKSLMNLHKRLQNVDNDDDDDVDEHGLPLLRHSSSSHLHKSSSNEVEENKQEEEEKHDDDDEDDELPQTQELLQLAIPVSEEDEEGEEEASSKTLLEEALATTPIPPRKKTVRQELATYKKPAAKTVTKKRPTATKTATSAAASTKPSNYAFTSKSFGEYKAELYSFKSYIRYKDTDTSKLKLIIQCEGPNHSDKIQQLVDECKKAGQSKETLVAFRANL